MTSQGRSATLAKVASLRNPASANACCGSAPMFAATACSMGGKRSLSAALLVNSAATMIWCVASTAVCAL